MDHHTTSTAELNYLNHYCTNSFSSFISKATLDDLNDIKNTLGSLIEYFRWTREKPVSFTLREMDYRPLVSQAHTRIFQINYEEITAAAIYAILNLI